MTDRWSRLAPLTGVLFAVITLVAVFTGGETPDANARPGKVIHYYATHTSEVETSAILIALAFLFLVLFAGALRAYLRQTPAAEGPSALVPIGAGLMAIGVWSVGAIEYGLAHNLGRLGPQTAQTLSFLSNELFIPILGGAFVFMFCAGLAIVRGAPLPKWLGWVAIVLGILAVIPPVGFFSLILVLVWILVVSILVYQRSGKPAATPGPSATEVSPAA
jgi:hypothetical protein